HLDLDRAFPTAHRHAEGAAPWHGVQRVEEQVDEHRVQLVAVHRRRHGPRCALSGNFDVLLAPPCLHQVHGTGDDVAQVAVAAARRGQAGKVEEVLDRLFQAGDFTVDDV